MDHEKHLHTTIQQVDSSNEKLFQKLIQILNYIFFDFMCILQFILCNNMKHMHYINNGASWNRALNKIAKFTFATSSVKTLASSLKLYKSVNHVTTDRKLV